MFNQKLKNIYICPAFEAVFLSGDVTKTSWIKNKKLQWTLLFSGKYRKIHFGQHNNKKKMYMKIITDILTDIILYFASLLFIYFIKQ